MSEGESARGAVSEREPDDEVMSHILELLCRCPHSVWALSAVCSRIATNGRR